MIGLLAFLIASFMAINSEEIVNRWWSKVGPGRDRPGSLCRPVCTLRNVECARMNRWPRRGVSLSGILRDVGKKRPSRLRAKFPRNSRKGWHCLRMGCVIPMRDGRRRVEESRGRVPVWVNTFPKEAGDTDPRRPFSNNSLRRKRNPKGCTKNDPKIQGGWTVAGVNK